MMFPQPCFSDIESFEIVNTEFEEYIGEANKPSFATLSKV